MTEKTCPTCHRPLPADAPLCPVCALLGAREETTPAGIPPLEEIQAAFPQFEILECIGRGGMGIVYKVRQPQLDRRLALKILLPGLERDPGFAERFAREARALAKLSHPNIIAVHDFGESGGFFWLTMEYVDGVNLRQAMQAARFTPAQSLAVVPDLCAALQYAHDHGVLHRDIKPENILLDARGRVKVADFGIARMAGDERAEFTLTMTGAALGSAAYIAPEQIENPRDVDHRADLYSLGVVLYEMLTGGLPLGRFPAPSERSASDPRLDEVVFKALEKERERRFQSADEVKAGVATACATPASQPKMAAVERSAGDEEPRSLPSAYKAAGLSALGSVLCVTWLPKLWHNRDVYSEADQLLGNSHLATTANLVLAVMGVVALACVVSGVVLGIHSLATIRASRGKLRGAGMAWAAIAIPALLATGPAMALKLVLLAILFLGIPVAVFAAIRNGRQRMSNADPAPRPPSPPSQPGNLVPWSIGLVLAGATILGVAAAAESLLIAAPGACSAVLGIAAGWWALWRMKKGTLPTAGRIVLRVLFAWLPLLAGSVTLAFLVADDFSPWFGGKGDYLAKVAFVFLATFLPAAGLFHLAALPGVRGGRRGVVAAAVVLAIAALAGGKWLDGRWPVANYRATAYVRLENPAAWKRQAPAIQEALKTAAGPYADRIEFSSGEDPIFGRDAGVVRFIAPDKDQWESHWEAIVARLANLLPAESYVGLDWNLLGRQAHHPFRQPDYSFRHFVFSSCVLIAAALSALLGAAALFPVARVPLLVFLAGTAIAVLTPPVKRDVVVDGPVLPPLVPVVPPTDFSTPVNAARSVLDAARAGDLESLKRGMSRRNRVFLDSRDGWPLAMENLGQRAVVSPSRDSRPIPNRKRVHRQLLMGSGTLDMFLEDGEWRLDELPFDVPEKP